jgi:hypothetical protein
VTKTGYVPNFYGNINNLELKLWQPHLDMFLPDTNLPSAIFLEYIPDLCQLHLGTYSKERMEKFRKAIIAINDALVMHNDLRSRNFMIAPGDPDRVVLLDFDRSRTYDEETITAQQRRYLHEEMETVQQLDETLVRLFSGDHSS